jgi:hypothetical protein
LGSDAELESWLGGFHARMLWRSAKISGENLPPPALKLRPILRALHQKFWAPVSAAFPAGTTNVAFSPDARVFLTAGLCGGFTTFSTFSYESFELLEHGHHAQAAGYILASLALSLLAAAAGVLLARNVASA